MSWQASVAHPSRRYRSQFLWVMLAAAAFSCDLPFGEDTNSIATAVAATLTAGAPTSLPTPSPTPTTAFGSISGQVCYPSEGIPPMTAYFENVLTHGVNSLAIAQNQSSYTVDVAPGTYYAYAWVDPSGLGGSYSQAVPCGLTAACVDHSLIEVGVSSGVTTSGVDLCDWYGGPGSIPTPPGAPAATPASAVPPPVGGISLNCDNTYQRVRLTDAGPAGRTLWVDSWDGALWNNVWSVAGGDPNIRQIEPDAGAYEFLGCQNLVILPIRYSGSGAYLELSGYVWDGAGLEEVYHHEGTHGVWFKSGDTIEFEESLYLFNEPTCCPCNQQALHHTWNGSAFLETSSAITPTYTGTPPEECSGP